MYTRRNIRWNVIYQFAFWPVIAFTLWNLVVVAAFTWMLRGGHNISLPIAPLGTIGVAVAFYIGFKNNQSYDRNWEARKIWGGIVNCSRAFANQVLSYISAAHSEQPFDEAELADLHRTIIYRHLAWMHALRFQLRRRTPSGFDPKGAARFFMQETDLDAMRDQLCQLLSEKELTVVCDQVNSATQILRLQTDHLQQVIERDRLTDEFRYIALMANVTEMYALQGKCERIKNTPFPRQYAYFSNLFTWIFIVLLPFGIVGEFASRGDAMVWLAVPFTTIVGWIFFTMETVGDASEDPFENFINDVPMTALCRTVEIDLRQMMSEKDVPEPLKPVSDILM
ncbi:bestrophin family protein [Planctomycetes bacterium K23_9]|uniref:Bestrophin, RFP-TM, chloride channel n=1 Tax=Stieleria marina TaxID=1930275 RepID=A0A517NT14_9BACT|nr:Bestrophin, RFP-TM, chloride channel [Planctomycetes bacterium K23_9]